MSLSLRVACDTIGTRIKEAQSHAPPNPRLRLLFPTRQRHGRVTKDETSMPTVDLRLIVTSDLHMQLTDFDYCLDRTTGAQSMAHLGPAIRSLRAERPHALLVDLGDLLQGNPLSDHIAAAGHVGRDHPMVRAMNRLHYDAVVPGNHDFDYGLDFTRNTLYALTARIVCCNLRPLDEGCAPAPFVIVEREVPAHDGTRHSLRIALIGFTTPALSSSEVAVDDILDAARTVLPAVQRERPDLTVALCHSGISASPQSQGMENAAAPLAALAGIDVVLAGHTHQVFPDSKDPVAVAGVDTRNGTLHGKPAMIPGSYAANVGCMDLTLDRDGQGGWQVVDHTARFVPPSETPCARLQKDVAPLHAATRAAMAVPVGRTEAPLHSWFEAMGADLTLPVVAAAQRAAMAKVTGPDGPPLLVAVPSMRAGGQAMQSDFLHIPAGPILRRHVAALVPFDDPLCVVSRRGWQIRDWLEFAARRFRQVPQGAQGHPLLNPDQPGYHMDSFFGLTYRIDLSMPPLFQDDGTAARSGPGRIRDLRHMGRSFEDDDRFLVVTNTYRARGGGAIRPVHEQDIVHTAKDGARRALDSYFRADPQIAPAPCPVWSFAPMPGTSVTFETAAAATARLPQGVRPVGPAGPDRMTVALDL